MGYFDAIFDDVFQQPVYARSLGNPSPVSSTDISVAFALSVVLDEPITVPARMLVDHLPFQRLLSSPGWSSLVRHLVRPVAVESDWDTFLDECGGAPGREPLYMSSYEDRNQEVLAAWAGGRDYQSSRMAFKTSFPHAVTFVDEMRRIGARLNSYPTLEVSYSQALEARLQALPLPTALGKRFRNVQTRGQALNRLTELSERLSERHSRLLTVAINGAKHDELAENLGVNITALTGRRASLAGDDVGLTAAEELPALGAIVGGSLLPEHLTELLDNPRFLDLRSQFRASLGQDDQQVALRRLCEEAAVVIGKDESLKRVGRAARFGIGMLSTAVQSLAAPKVPLQCVLVFGGAVLCLSECLPENSLLWRRLFCDRRLYKRLLSAARESTMDGDSRAR